MKWIADMLEQQSQDLATIEDTFEKLSEKEINSAWRNRQGAYQFIASLEQEINDQRERIKEAELQIDALNAARVSLGIEPLNDPPVDDD